MSVNTIPADEAVTSGKPTICRCFHCGLPVPRGTDFEVEIAGEARPMCCGGCRAVARAIVDAGQEAFYRHRTGRPATGRELLPEFLSQTGVFDHPSVQKTFVTRQEGSIREAHLIIEGIVCAACIWLNEQHLRQLPGVQSVQINYGTRRARLRWDDSRIRLSEILQAIARIGYTAHPYDPRRQQQLMEIERKQYLRRIGIAGVLGVQVMMMAVALYAGGWSGMESGFRDLFHWVSLGLTAPVVLFAARPFYVAAWRDLRRRSVGMDVPVAIAISIAFAASALATFTGDGDVYYDSVVMFVFFLLTARYLELNARKHATESLDAIAHRIPASATRLGDSGKQETVPVAELRKGDRVLIRPGETVPADGSVLAGCSGVDESLLSGESLPGVRRPGDRLIGGSTNVESPLEMCVEKVGEETVLSGIVRLMERAQMDKPTMVLAADRVASWFVALVLCIAAVVAVAWYFVDATRWLPITISVLVITCPCALSLATPAAVTAAMGRLAGLSLLVTRGHALETLAATTHVIFDKTGTLTKGRLSLVKTVPWAHLSSEECLRRAAALERFSEHPIARALLKAAGETDLPVAQDVRVESGAGIQARLDGRIHYVGTLEYVRGQVTDAMNTIELQDIESGGGTIVFLSTEQKLLAGFVLQDTLRPDAAALIQELKSKGRQVMIMSGDNEAAVREVAGSVAIDQFTWALKPQDKLRKVRQLQQDGAVVAMVGDGVNDAPVLAQAQVSIAMGSGAALAAANSDVLLVSGRVANIAAGFRVARATQRIIRQNLAWAIAYNLLALPAAAAGFIAPWAAAVGMSASSLLVVANALRLRRV